MIKINGVNIDKEELSLMEYLQEHGFQTHRIAVECNEMIVPKSKYESWVLHSGDVVEVVCFVGGG
ncbi:MAG: sulfur carrier protein ThiS [Lachnospiraceae bacterium]|nr:sulfur carrier protein ThiS [Lachnospiraceae bacterium]